MKTCQFKITKFKCCNEMTMLLGGEVIVSIKLALMNIFNHFTCFSFEATFLHSTCLNDMQHQCPIPSKVLTLFGSILCSVWLSFLSATLQLGVISFISTDLSMSTTNLPSGWTWKQEQNYCNDNYCNDTIIMATLLKEFTARNDMVTNLHEFRIT